MKNTKTFKVVMLPTEKASKLYLDSSVKLQYHFDIERTKPDISQHLYITSTDEIKEGDWFVNELNQIWQHNGKVQPSVKSKKIVATTDKSLVNSACCISKDGGLTIMNKGCAERNRCLLPQLPEAFIQAYIKAYNEGKTITEVALETEITHEGNGTYSMRPEDLVNLTPVKVVKTRSDNTVIIHQAKLYSREEVESLCIKAYQEGQSNWDDYRKNVMKFFFEENL
jgi:hypothetical protein